MGVGRATVDQGNLDVPAGAGNVEVKPVLLGVPASFISGKTFLRLLRRKEKQMENNGSDSRRAELMARRYHVTIEVQYSDGLTRSGEFFYDSLRAARAFIRNQYQEFFSCWGCTVMMPANGWKHIWAAGGFRETVEEDGGEFSHFEAQLIDTQHASDRPRRLVQLTSDLRAEAAGNL